MRRRHVLVIAMMVLLLMIASAIIIMMWMGIPPQGYNGDGPSRGAMLFLMLIFYVLPGTIGLTAFVVWALEEED